jgi:hypothetical protein
LALKKFSKILKKLKFSKEKFSLNLYSKETQLTTTIDTTRYELSEAIIKKFHKEKSFGFLMNKKNFNLLKSLHGVITQLADLIYGVDQFLDVLRTRDPAFFEILEKLKICVWGEKEVEMKINLFDRVFFVALVMTMVNIEDEEILLRSCKMALFCVYLFPEYLNELDFQGMLKSLVQIYKVKFGVEVPEKIDNYTCILNKRVREVVDSMPSMKVSFWNFKIYRGFLTNWFFWFSNEAKQSGKT